MIFVTVANYYCVRCELADGGRHVMILYYTKGENKADFRSGGAHLYLLYITIPGNIYVGYMTVNVVDHGP